ncbi:CRISPR-associated helicase Cas3' [Emticicia fluvialis]|uniref:CRISPR-associated helicase Cas3' n=1 Tax=Emticicia fluvialis TaxID=2974474 RepID=UPI0021668360|nr:CRISPR-associated helicase Cas3' [Emticicia fluvialis]
MYNSYETVASIIKTIPPIETFLIDAELYYAHVSPKNYVKQRTPETLKEHIELVQQKFELLVEKHHLDGIIDNLINEFLKDQKITDTNEIGLFIKRLFVNVIIFHDFGKINENFQANPDKMNNPYFKGKEKLNSPISTHHSSLGAYLFIVKQITDAQVSVDRQYHSTIMLAILMFSYCIFKHHGKYLNDEYKDKISFSVDEVNCMKQYVSHYQFDIPLKNYEILPLHLTKAFNELESYNFFNSFALYSLIRLNFSLLTASDYLASSQYMTGIEISDMGVLSSNRINQLFDFVSSSDVLKSDQEKKNYNKETYKKINTGYISPNPTEQSNKNLNALRQAMAIEVIENIRANSLKNLFYIEAPTGGGKTNLSILATIELLHNSKGRINKVFYVFPFTTLITQTYSSIKETLGLNENEIVQLHSKAGYKQKEHVKFGIPAPEQHIDTKQLEEEKDGIYSNEKENYIDNLFVNYPFCLLSHVKFFDLLKTNEKEGNYLLHRLANSVVVIDELQSYDPTHWDKIIYFVHTYAKLYNIKFILMSATLPKLGNLELIKKDFPDEFVYLLPTAKQDYFLNPNFSERIKFNFDLLERTEISLDEIAQILHTKSKEYSQLDFGEAKPFNSVYCIIEFIFKKSATNFYQIITELNQHESLFDEILVLSGTILEHRRKEIINFLKNPANRKKRILLITTQVVEAGVDIDMDLGFKDKSMIDSEEQLAGRINRNVNKKECTLHLFNFNQERIIYGQDKRYQEMKKLKIDDYKRILREKDFDFLYNTIFTRIDITHNSDKLSIDNHQNQLKHYQPKIKNLKFQSVHNDFKLIEQENISCFVPVSIPIYVQGVTPSANDSVFSKGELEFLEENSVIPTANMEIDGEEVFDLYLSIIKNKKEFIQQKIAEKTLQGIMSKFIFSLFASKNIENQIVHYSDEVKSEYGYKYLVFWREFYDIKFGLDTKRFSSSETQFL